MRESIACGLLIACAALFPSQNAAGEEPSRRIVPARRSPQTVGQGTGAHGKPPIRQKQRAHVSSRNAPTRSPANVRPERPSKSQPEWKGGFTAPVDPPTSVARGVESSGEIAPAVTTEPETSDETPVEADQGAFLLPVWSPGFWAMPPGGLTRYLFPSRDFVNPDETLVGTPTGPLGRETDWALHLATLATRPRE